MPQKSYHLISKRAIQKYLEDPMAEYIISAELKEGDLICVELNKEKDGINVTLKKSTPKPPKKSTKKSE